MAVKKHVKAKAVDKLHVGCHLVQLIFPFGCWCLTELYSPLRYISDLSLIIGSFFDPVKKKPHILWGCLLTLLVSLLLGFGFRKLVEMVLNSFFSLFKSAIREFPEFLDRLDFLIKC